MTSRALSPPLSRARTTRCRPGETSERRRDHRSLGLCLEPEKTMKARVAALGLAAIFSGLPNAAHAAEEPLKVCLAQDRPPFSSHRRGKPDAGFDVTLAQGIADLLGRPLKIQWFESKHDEDSSPQLEANALLSDGRCSLVGGYALTRDSLVVPAVKTAQLPEFERT